MGAGIEVQRVVGFGHKQVAVTCTLFFRRNCQPVIAEEVKSISKTVVIDTCKVLFDRVLLTGRVRKSVLFRELGPSNGDVARVGDVLAQVGFSVDLDVRGARPGDCCVVVKAFVAGGEESPVGRTPCAGFRGLVDSSVVSLCVKVVRLEITGDHDDISDGSCDSSSGTGSHGDSDDSEHGASCKHSDSSDHSGKDCDSAARGRSFSQTGSHAKPRCCDDSGQGRRCSSGESSDSDHAFKKGKGCRRKGCPKPKTTGLVIGGNGTVPDVQPGSLPGSYIGPTILFPGIF